MLNSSRLFSKGLLKKNVIRKKDFNKGRGTNNPVNNKLEEDNNLGYATLGRFDGNSFEEVCYGSSKGEYDDYVWGDWN